MTFTTRLKALGMKRIDLARVLGVEPDTAWRWKDDPPAYALAYVDLLETMKRARDILAVPKG